MTPERLILRVDGGGAIGWGHVARCFALAQAWIDKGAAATVASRSLPTEWAKRCDREGIDVREPERVDYQTADWVVLDGYHFGDMDRRAIASAGSRVVVIDDHGLSQSALADVIVDQNLGATAFAYDGRRNGTELLLGPRYALLRREFGWRRAQERPSAPRARSVVVSMGGSPSLSTETAFAAVLAREELAGLELIRLSGADDVASVMAGAELALAASGATCWELCCMGLPAVLVAVADNQMALARALEAEGVALNAGPVETIDPEGIARALTRLAHDPAARTEMGRRGKRLVDGRGAKRVVAYLRASLLRLRPAGPEDAALLWEWANDPVVRQAAFSTAPIPWDDHVLWLARHLADPDSYVYVASSSDDKPVGVVRFQRDGPIAEISVVVAQNRRGEGWGPAIIHAGVRSLFEESDNITAVTARVKPENRASLTSFDDAAFVVAGEGQDGANPWVEHIRYREAVQ